MRVTKKKLRQINFLTVANDILSEDFDHPCSEENPELWNNYEKEQFDIATAVEDKVKAEVLKILSS